MANNEGKKDAIVFNPKPVGEMINPHVHRPKPEREPDCIASEICISPMDQ
jgi:hypothetical protein